MRFIRKLSENYRIGKGTRITQEFEVGERVDEKLGTFFGQDDSLEFGAEDHDFERKMKSKVYISYPLDCTAEFEVEYKTLYELIDEIRRAYQHIYKNADTTNPFGIWGHDMGDLWIEEIHIYGNGDISMFTGS